MKISKQNLRNTKSSIGCLIGDSSSNNKEDKAREVHIYHPSAIHPKLKDIQSEGYSLDIKACPTTSRRVLASEPFLDEHLSRTIRTPPEKQVQGIVGMESCASHRSCNCKRSNCLKLYCDCFASGEYCKNCNCLDCYNNLEKESLRGTAIRAIRDRNPNAFRPKITSAVTSPALQDSDFSLQKKHNKVRSLLFLGLCL